MSQAHTFLVKENLKIRRSRYRCVQQLRTVSALILNPVFCLKPHQTPFSTCLEEAFVDKLLFM